HIMELVENVSNRVVLLADGKVVADGDFAQLQTQNQEGSLEKIFNQLTGFNDQENIVETFINRVMQDDGCAGDAYFSHLEYSRLFSPIIGKVPTGLPPLTIVCIGEINHGSPPCFHAF